jgi:hypothetical protein
LGFGLKILTVSVQAVYSQILKATVADPILGTDFLRQFRITEPPVSVSLATQKIPDSVPEDVKCRLQKFRSILHTGGVMPTLTHGVEHHIHTGSHPPVFTKSHHLDQEKLEIAKAEFKRVESGGVVCHSKSPWASPLHMVPKKDGSWRPCGDCRRLNLVMTLESTPCQTCKTFQTVCMVAVFSKIDLVKGYHQIPVAATDIPKTAIITSFSLFEYLFMPFELSNAAQTFQRMMDRTTDGLEGVFAYMDDSCVGSPDRQTHLLHLEAFFNVLATMVLPSILKNAFFSHDRSSDLSHRLL